MVSGIPPFGQVSGIAESLTTDETWGSEIKDWSLPDTRVANWGLPGHSSIVNDVSGGIKDSCGTFFMKGCLNVEEHPDGQAVFKPFVHRCFDPKCPVCWRSWASREADRIEKRILAAQEQKRGLGRPIHAVASVPQRLWYVSKEDLAREAQAVAGRVGFLGGSCIYHAFREKKESKRWYFSPHFHMLGFGWIVGTKEEYESSGWIFKNARVRKSVRATALYELSHCAVWYGAGKKHSVTWFGAVSYNKLRCPRSRGLDQVCCPVCGSPIQKLVWKGSEAAPLPCSGIDGFYFASAEGWEAWSEVFVRMSMSREHYV
jgi:hypothetical protein